MTEIPANCIFNKRLTGCGATELAIRNDVPTIIAMPFVALVKNKTVYRTDNRRVFGVYEGVTEQDIADYVNTAGTTLKIVVTYDSLPRTLHALHAAGINPYKEMFLLVDEWHVLFNSYIFRHDAIQQLFAEAARFERVTYMSATPVERQYMLKELRDMPVCEVV